MNRRQKIIVIVTGIFIVLLILIGLTYAYFLTRITGNGNPTSISVTTANLELVYGDGTTAILTSKNPLIPSSTPIGTKDFTVTNNGDDSEYVVVFEDITVKYAADTVINGQTVTAGTETTFESNDFEYTLICTKKDGTPCEGVQESFPMSGGVVVLNKIKKGDVHNYILTLYYLDNGLDQSVDMNKTLNGKVNIYDKKLYFRNLSEISPTVLSNLNSNLSQPESSRATTEPFFQIPIANGKTLEVINNSDDFKIAVYLSKNGLETTVDSGWILAGESKSVIPKTSKNYLRLIVTSNDGKTADINSIDLSKFIVKYSDSDENLLEKLSLLEQDYNNYSLKNYAANEVSEYVNSSTRIAHGGGIDDPDLKSTMTALISAIEEKGFKSVEVDVRATKDNKFVLYHDATISGMSTTIASSTLDELKAVKNDLLTLDEALSYLSSQNAVAVLDVKGFSYNNRVEQTNELFSIIEANNMQDSFVFAACPNYLRVSLPEEYKDVAFSVYEDWSSDYIGKNVFYSSGIRLIDLDELVSVLKAGHKKFEIWDSYSTDFDNVAVRKLLAAISYICESYGAEVRFTFFTNREFDFSDITEDEILRIIPSSIWKELNLLQRN